MFLVRQKDKWRMVFDYRQLNKATVPQVAVMPRAEGIEARTAKADIMSKGDYKASYNQIAIRDGDQWKTAFSSPLGLFEWQVMPFGLRNAPAHMQSVIERVVNLPRSEKFIDDWLIHDSVRGLGFAALMETVRLHAQRLKEVLLRSRAEGLKLKKGKEAWFCEEMEFLGILMKSGGRIAPTADSVETMRGLAPPASLEALQSFMGAIGWLRKFIYGLNTTLAPLQSHLNEALRLEKEAKQRNKRARKGEATQRMFPLREGSIELRSFHAAVAGLVGAKDLWIPRHDTPKRVVTDASNEALGAVMFQRLESASGPPGWVPCAITSRKLPDAATRYRIVEKEAFAIVHALRTWSTWLRGVHFDLYSDHRAVECLTSGRHAPPSGRLARWAEIVGMYNFSLRWVPGKAQSVLLPDYLSRHRTEPEQRDKTRAELIMEATESDPGAESVSCQPVFDDGFADDDMFWESPMTSLQHCHPASVYETRGTLLPREPIWHAGGPADAKGEVARI